jgi:hypothetical protein
MFIVICLDEGQYKQTRLRPFDTTEEARRYMTTISPSRRPIIVDIGKTEEDDTRSIQVFITREEATAVNRLVRSELAGISSKLTIYDRHGITATQVSAKMQLADLERYLFSFVKEMEDAYFREYKS